jgi:hypothetical protein
MIYNYMSLDKKLKKIEQTVMIEAKEQEKELGQQIDKYMEYITYNSGFLENLSGIKRKFK